MSTVRLDVEGHYSLYENMCKGHNFPPLPKESVDELFCYLVNGVPMYTCLLWNTYSNMCLLGFPVSNLEVPTEKREGMLSSFLSGIEDWCKDEGYNLIWTTSSTERVIKSLEELGYQKGDQNVQTYIKLVS